jgi:hypothetical protein
MSTARLRLDRFSPFHDRAAEHGFRRVRPAHAYFHVFPLGRRELSRLAYFFDYDYDDARVPEAYAEPLRRAVATWWQHRREAAPHLDAHDDGETIVIEDTRAIATAPAHRLEGVAARVFAHCDQARSLQRLSEEELAAVEALEADHLVTVDEGRCLSLAVFRSRPDPTRSPRIAAAAAA